MKVFASSKFWLAVIAVTSMALKNVLPTTVNPVLDAAAAFAVILIGSFTAVDGMLKWSGTWLPTAGNPFKRLGASKEFWTAVIGLIGIVAATGFNAPPDVTGALQNLIFILIGTATIEHVAAARNGSIKPTRVR